jgi:hypothetical protein
VGVCDRASRILSRRDLRRLFGQLFEWDGDLERVGQHHTVLHDRFHPVLVRGGVQVKLPRVDDVAIGGHPDHHISRNPGRCVLRHLVHQIFPFGRPPGWCVPNEAAATELGLLEDWIGKGNRESQTLPVLHLRETATKMGLLRKHRGMLLLTAAGRRLRTDPVSLWWHLAERMPPRSADRCETQAGLIWLLAVAAQWPGDPAEIVARTLAGIGWALADGTPLSTLDADRAAWDTRNVLRRLGGLTEDPRHYGAGSPNTDGAAFARAAVSTWPDADKPP